MAVGVACSMPTAIANGAAADASVLYVNNATTANCSDAGSGTQAQPYCTISAAAAVAQPGQAVEISPGQGYAEEVDITRSGAPGAPITFTSAPGTVGAWVGKTGDAFSFFLDGANDIVIQGLGFAGAYRELGITNSSDISVAYNRAYGSSENAGDIELDGISSHVTISHNDIESGQQIGISIGSGVSDTTISSNYIRDTFEPSVSAMDAPDTVVTGNSMFSGCNNGLVLAGTSTGATVEDNIVDTASYSYGGPAACPAYESGGTGITVAAGATAGTKVAYNIIDPAGGGPAYSWAGTSYSSVASFAARSKQGSHDLVTLPLVNWQNGDPAANSPAINSADADAPGETATDVWGDPRVDDRMVPETGTGPSCYDRGAVQFDAFGSSYTSVTPLRVLDTRSAIGVATKVPVAPGATVRLPLAGTHGLPTDLTNLAAVLNVTVTDTQASGHLSVLPELDSAQQPPSTTSLTWGPGQTVASLLTTAIDDGSVVFTNESSGTVDVVADLEGYYSMLGSSGFTSLAPQRILDTRSAIGVPTRTPVKAGGTVSLRVDGVGGVSGSHVTAVVLNVTATDPTAATYVSVYPDGAARPTASNLNAARGQTIANEVIAPVGADGRVDLYNRAGSTHLIADVEGYYSTTGLQTAYTLAPTTFLDTQSAVGVGTAAPLGPGASVTLAPTDLIAVRGPLPARAVILNVTVQKGTAAGYLTVYASGAKRPAASNLNWVPGQSVSNQVIVPLGSDGKITFYNSAGKVQVLASIAGYFSEPS